MLCAACFLTGCVAITSTGVETYEVLLRHTFHAISECLFRRTYGTADVYRVRVSVLDKHPRNVKH